MESKIFISYSRKDYNEVNKIVKQIEDSLCVQCWIDKQGIESSDDYRERILNAIDDAEIFLFMLSQNSLAAEYPRKEIDYAKNIKKKHIVPICLGNDRPKGWFLFDYGRLDYICASNEEQMKKLIRDISKWLKIDLKEVRIQSSPSVPNYLIKIKSIANCTVYVDDIFFANIKANKLYPLEKPQGEYLVRCISENDNIVYEEKINLTQDKLILPTFENPNSKNALVAPQKGMIDQLAEKYLGVDEKRMDQLKKYGKKTIEEYGRLASLTLGLPFTSSSYVKHFNKDNENENEQK